MVEAVSEGVIMNSLEYLLSIHINRMVIIRPKISQEERLNQLVAVLQYVGAEYDFKFDFTDDSYQCCTELVYRTINVKAQLISHFPGQRGGGFWTRTGSRVIL